MNRNQIAALVFSRLDRARDEALASYRNSDAGIGHFVVDDLLPVELAHEISVAFPDRCSMTAKNTIRERKAIMARVGECSPIIGEITYALQDPRVVETIADITGVRSIQPDPHLYAAGLSSMRRGDFLNPHLDNSHDKDRQRWRALNLLYYVTPHWPDNKGGNLELWPGGVAGAPTTIHSRFNRLAVMATHGTAWHSVSPVQHDGVRRCVSSYYFTPHPLRQADQFHVTSFRGRPEEPIRDAVLRADSIARSVIRKLRPAGVAPLTHCNAGAEIATHDHHCVL